MKVFKLNIIRKTLASIIFIVQFILADTFIVDQNGNGDYTAIGPAISGASSGDTIRVKSGTYYESLDINNKQLVIIGAGAKNTIISNGGNALYQLYNNLEITGFTFESTGKAAVYLRQGSVNFYQCIFKTSNYTGDYEVNSAVYIINHSSSKVNFYNCLFKDSNQGITYSSGEGDGVKVYNSIFRNNTYGVRTNNSFLVLNSIFYKNTHALTKSRFAATITAAYNIYYDNDNLDQGLAGSNYTTDDPEIDFTTYAVKTTSPAIDSGNPSAVYNDRDGTRNDKGVYGGPHDWTEGPVISSYELSSNSAETGDVITLTATSTQTVIEISQTVTNAEFFVNSDPGEGSGTALNASDGSFDSAEENITGSINTTNITHGSNKIYVRAKSSRGGWGEASSVALQINDTVAPTISSVSMASNNSTIAVTFSEAVYNTNTGSGALEVTDFSFSLTSGIASLSLSIPTSITVSGNVYTLGVGFSGIPEDRQTLTVNPIDDSIYDIVGNEISQTQTNNSVALFGPDKYTINIDGTGNYTTIQSGIDNSSTKHGDTLLVYPGTYEGPVDYKKKNIVLASRYVTTNDTTYRDKTVIKGTVTMDSLDSNAALIGFMIYKNGVSVKSGSPVLKRLHIREHQGPGLEVSGAKLTINDLEVKSNNTNLGGVMRHGGGININSSTVTINNAIIDSNVSNYTNGYYGGGLHSTNGSHITITNSQINDNLAAIGGGIYSANDSSFTMDNVSVRRDSSTNLAGGMWFNNTKTPIQLSNVWIEDNRSNSYGGGIYVESASLHITNASISNNVTQNNSGGGLYYYENSAELSVEIKSTSFIGNQAQTNGGGAFIHFNGANNKATLSNVLFAKNKSGNTSGLYSGISYSTSAIQVINNTFVLNEGTETVSLINSGTREMINTIVWHNTSSAQAVMGPKVTYSNIEGGHEGDGNINTDPVFVDYVNGDYRLSDYSPSLGAGTATGAPTTDIEGNIRPNPTGSSPDMGAYESILSTRLSGNTIYVAKTGNDINDGSFESPFLTVQRGLDRTYHGDTLLVYPGLYEELVDYKGKNVVLASRYLTTNDSTYRDQTVIQGSVTMDSLDSNAALIGFMIYKNGVSVKSGSPVLKRLHIREHQGPGLEVSGAKLTINDLEVKSNNTNLGGVMRHGGGININSSTVTINNAIIDSNVSNYTNGYYGGGLHSTNGSHITITNSQINDNLAAIGGGIYSSNDSSFTMDNVSVRRDSSLGLAGGMWFYNTKTPIQLSNVWIEDNRSNSSGGGIYVESASLHITNASISNNVAQYNSGGGLYYYENSAELSVEIKSTSFIGNQAETNGGGAFIYFNGPDNKATLSNVLFAKNKSGNTSGLYSTTVSASAIQVINNTFVLNEGGSIVNLTNSGTREIINTIVWHNTSSAQAVMGPKVTYSNIEGGHEGDGNINTDPVFVDYVNGDYRLSDSSPSLGAGTLEGAPTTDIEGNPRPNPAGSAPDMGAYESSKSTRVTGKYYVMKTGNDQYNGSISSPFLTIQRGLDAGYHGDTVIVYPGKYEESVDYNSKNIVLASRYLTTNDSTYRDQTVIQGKVTMDSLDSTAALIGFMIYKNQVYVRGGSPGLKLLHIREVKDITMGALFIREADVTVDNIKLIKNSNIYDSAALTIQLSSVTLNNVVSDSNYNSGFGSGLYTYRSHIVVNNSQFNDNISERYGGGVHSFEDSSYTMNNVTIARNKNNGEEGGGMYIKTNSSASYLNNMIIDSNDSEGNGGGIFSLGSNLIISNSIIMNNNTNRSGGGIYFNTDLGGDSLKIINTSFINNFSMLGGGGIDAYLHQTGNVQLTYILFAENRGENGAFIISSTPDDNSIRIVNNTFVKNIGKYTFSANQAKVEFINNIVWNNTFHGSNILMQGPGDYNNIEGGSESGGEGNINLDPQFVDPDNGNYSLQPTSPSIDTGHPDLDGDGDTWESDTDDQDPDGTRMDMGSAWFSQLESEPPTIEITNIDENTKLGSGKTKAITWTATDNFRIDWTKLYLKAPDSTSFTLMDSVYGNPGTYDYQVPLKISKDYYMKISVSDPSGNTAADTQRFEVIDATLPVITLLQPNPGLKILEYDTLDIEWSITDNHLLDSTWIYYSVDNLVNLIAVDSLKFDSLSYKFKIPKGVTKQAKIKIVSTDSTGNVGSVESASFEVVDNTKPTIAWTELSDKILNIGTSVDLGWTSTDNVGVEKVDLAYSKDQSTWIEVAKQITNQNNYNWQIANDPSTTLSLRIIGFDAVELSDTSTMSGYTIKESYPQITSTDATNVIDWKTKEVKLVFDQSLDANSISTSNFAFSSKQNDTQVPSFTYDENTKSITLKFDNGFISKDSLGVTVSGGIKSIYGYLFDGNADETPGGIYTFSFQSSLLGDYNNDSNIDAVDLAVLLSALQNNEIENELGPVEGSTAPYFKTIADGILDIEDVMAFVRLWNWKKENPNGSVNEWNSIGEIADIEFLHNNISFNTSDDAFVYELEIKFISGKFEVISSSLPNALLKYYDQASNTVYLTSEVDQDKINIPIKFLDRYGTVQISYRLLDEAGNSISQGSVLETIENIPNAFALHENYPNPFNPTTTLRFDIPEVTNVTLTVFNLLGQKVITFDYKDISAGYHSVKWDATNDFGEPVGAGVYLYQLQAKDFIKTRKMVLLK